METLHLISVPGMREGMAEPLSECVDEEAAGGKTKWNRT